MSFQISYEPCGAGQKTIIEKLPLKETPAQPIYPDLLDVYIDMPEMQELPLEETEDLANEEQGKSFSFSFEDLIKKGIDIAKIAFKYEDYKRRTTVFDPYEHKDEEKLPSDGKPPNNNDPYPVDEKIEELEQHIPFLKIHRLEYCEPHPHIVQLSKVVMDLSDKTEKRLVQIENILATVLRYTFRMGARMPVNCVYYGGQDNFRKYNCIRCLHDDRIRDGQSMTIDQCLTCTRYEPIVGQIYNIIDESGVNIDSVLDDNHMSYSTMEDYINFTRAEAQPEEQERALLDIENLEERNPDEKDFSEIWDEGFVMDWNLVPVEQQTPHVRYEDGSTSKTLDSNYKNIAYMDSFLGGGGYGTSLEGMAETMKGIDANQEVFDANTNANLQKYIDNGRAYAQNNTDAALKRMADEGYEDIIRELCEKEGVDPLLIMALIVVESGGRVEPNDAGDSYWGLMQVYYKNLSSNYNSKPKLEKARENIQVGIQMYKAKLRACWNTTNNVLGTCAFNSGEGMILGVSSKDVPPIHNPGLNKSEHNTWLWTQIAPNLERNVRTYYGQKAVLEKLTYYPRVHFVYQILKEKKGSSPYDASNLKFPFRPEDIGKVTFTSDFGMRVHPITGDYSGHMGVDLAAPQGTPLFSIADGRVTTVAWQENYKNGKKTGAGQYIMIDHGNNFFSMYMHLVKGSQKVKQGDQVKAGQYIGDCGTTGGSTGPHLHLEIREGGSARKNCVDPKKYFPMLNGQLGKRLKI